MIERLQKFLARAGLGSRRQIEDWIRQGRITVDGTPAQLGVQVSGTEQIQIDGRPIRLGALHQQRRVLAYYKPVGEMTTRHDPEGRPTIFDRLPSLRDGRWITVGRLDLNTQGLLLVTNDGELANRLMHPSSQIEREYAIRVLGKVPPEILERLREGVALEDGLARFEVLREAGGEGANHWYHAILREGRNREVRRLWESQGIAVSRLVRVRYGPVALRRGLHPGHWDELSDAQIELLLAAVDRRSVDTLAEKVAESRHSLAPDSVKPSESRGDPRTEATEPRQPPAPWAAPSRRQPAQRRDPETEPRRPHPPAAIWPTKPPRGREEERPSPRGTFNPWDARPRHDKRDDGPSPAPRRPFNPGRARSGR